MGLKFGRRVRNVWEVIEYGKYKLISEWSPSDDSFQSSFDGSILLDRIAPKLGKRKSELVREVTRREKLLGNMAESGKRSQKDVAETIMGYYGSGPVTGEGEKEVKHLWFP